MFKVQSTPQDLFFELQSYFNGPLSMGEIIFAFTMILLLAFLVIFLTVKIVRHIWSGGGEKIR